LRRLRTREDGFVKSDTEAFLRAATLQHGFGLLLVGGSNEKRLCHVSELLFGTPVDIMIPHILYNLS